MTESTDIPRRLSWTDTEGQQHVSTPDGLLDEPRPVVVLAEPGGGKTWLLDQLGKRTGTRRIPATRWIDQPRLSAEIRSDVPLLIDALDEASAHREGDAIGRVLAGLVDQGSPRFILTCRAADWQAYAASEIAQDYTTPLVCKLDPITRDDARVWLDRQLDDPEAVIDGLEAQGLIDLIGNPLTLKMVADVVRAHGDLPQSRADLYARTVRHVWREQNEKRVGSPLDRLDEVSALDGAGAICAAMLMGRYDAITTAGAGLAGDALSLSAITGLPGRGAVHAVLGSGLFRPEAPGRMIPLHRTVAEYLGARWLAGQVGRRSAGRLLARLQPGGVVPAQMRGLHAWLPHFSSLLGEGAITCDPYGVLRYGEVDALPVGMARRLLEELVVLADRNPYFRAGDWAGHSIAGLMRAELADRIAELIGSARTNGHLRTLLIGGLQGTALATRLADTLERILFDQERLYSERHDVLKALEDIRDREWQLATLDRLRIMADEDSTRIAVNLLGRIGAGPAGNGRTVEVLFADTGMTVCAWPQRGNARRNTITSYHRVEDAIDDDQLSGLLDLFADQARLCFPDLRWRGPDAIIETHRRLIGRALAIEPRADPAQLWRWMRPLTGADDGDIRIDKRLQHWLVDHLEVRRAVQAHVLFNLRDEADFATRLYQYLHDTPGLAPDLQDLKALLAQLSERDRSDPANREDWCHLLNCWPGRVPREADVLAIARPFAEGDAELEAVLAAMSRPQPPPEWEIRHQERRDQNTSTRLKRITEDRAWFLARRGGLRAGEAEEIGRAALAYLRLEHGLMAQTALGRLEEWLGEDLVGDALAGFEAVLHRSDGLSPWDASRKLATGRASHASLAALVGIVERVRNGRTLGDLPYDVLCLARLHESFTYLGDDRDDSEFIHETLQAAVERSPEDWTAWQRLTIEPQLETGEGSVVGLHYVAEEPRFPDLAQNLLVEWLERYSAMPQSTALPMIDALLRAQRFAIVQKLTGIGKASVLPDYRAALNWIAVDWTSDFERHGEALTGYGVRHPLLLFAIRDRLELDWEGARRTRLTDEQVEWLLREFCPAWHYTPRFVGASRSSDAQEASEILGALIDRLAASPLVEASAAFDRLLAMPDTGFHDNLRHAAAQHRQAQGEAAFQPVQPVELAALLADGPPATIDELRAIVLDVLDDVQTRLLGSDTDMAAPFWNNDRPHDENYGRDRLADLMTPYLEPYGIHRIPERDMPDDKRADLAFAHGAMHLPMEIKGQWHKQVWKAASGQLDQLYLRDWRAQDRGIYLVFWFGDMPGTPHRLRRSPDGVSPGKPQEMRAMLEARLPEHRRHAIAVRVVDLKRGARA